MGLGPLSEIMSEEDMQQSDKLKKTGNADEDLGSFETTGWSQAKAADKLAENSLSKFKSTRNQTSKKMFLYARETICFFLALSFTALAILHSSPPRISKPPAAKPFFNESSVVLDFYKGHLGALIDRVTDYDYSFVMYYAPWDAECQAVKEEFETVAQFYESQVLFAAINCWQPGSECKARYNKIQSFPVLMLYPSRESGVQYRGIRNAPYMIRFINSFMNPIKRVTNDEQLFQLLVSYDAVILGYFNFVGLANSPGYREFYRAALKSLEKDPNGDVVYCAITSSNVSKSHGINQFPSASLLLWNETLFYPETNEWTSESLLNWQNSAMHRVVTWVQPPGIKSSTFAPYFWEGPVLLLFTPRNPLFDENHHYNLLKEIALQYYDCAGNQQAQEISHWLKLNRLKALEKSQKKQEECIKYLEEYYDQDVSILVSHKEDEVNNNVTCCTSAPTNKCVSCPWREKFMENFCFSSDEESANNCKNFNFYDLLYFYRDYSENFASKIGNNKNYCHAKSCVDKSGEFDSQSSPAILEAYLREGCQRYLSAYTYQRPIIPRENNISEEVELTEHICSVNKTLAFVIIDSLYYFHFAEGLGIDILNFPDKTACVILDSQDESQFVMKEKFGRNNLAQFINDYVFGFLKRSMRSTNSKLISQKMNSSCSSENNKNRICISELTTETFLEEVLDPKKDVVVMYYSPYCAFCSAVSYVYLTVAQYLAKMDHLKFVRIDSDNNDLPWEYTINRFPSILFFPAHGKEDSTVFPSTLPISVGNLLNFVLANLDPESHIEALINVCASGSGGSLSDCKQRVRWLCLDVIQEHLKDFRKLRRTALLLNNNKVTKYKRMLLLKLEHVRNLHLELSSTDNLFNDRSKVKLLRNKFQRFYRLLENIRQQSDGQDKIGTESFLKSKNDTRKNKIIT